ncbi:hypothetical protein P4O66_000608 [Electrophorus voltai]|uniref:Uncharacterized protein n=1 Tax=Electrophorus voltai TaxID=2609070 RepID=A0AAD9DYW8_9TELE|nr:hypothetical protein P4O66_000608 [Electrophorus voltai]
MRRIPQPTWLRCAPPDIRLAEVERASLMSEQLSDKSSSPALPDDLSLDDHSVYQLIVRDKEERGSSGSQSLEELQSTPGKCRVSCPHTRAPSLGSEGSKDLESDLQDLRLLREPVSHQHTPPHSQGGVSARGGSVTCSALRARFLATCAAPHVPYSSLLVCTCCVFAADAERRSGGGRGEGREAPPRFRLPAEFFHPASAATQGSPAARGALGGASCLASPSSWASLRSPGANNRAVSSQPMSRSGSSPNAGKSEGSLHTTLEEGLCFSGSPPRDLTPPVPLVCPQPDDPPASLGCGQATSLAETGTGLQATRGSQRSCSASGCNRQDSTAASDEDTGIEHGSSKALNSEHLSEMLGSLSLTSLLAPGSLLPPLAKKCNSTGSLEQGSPAARSSEGRPFHAADQQRYVSGTFPAERGGGGEESTGLRVKKSSTQTMDAGCRKDR